MDSAGNQQNTRQKKAKGAHNGQLDEVKVHPVDSAAAGTVA